jgi:hypothetical protein
MTSESEQPTLGSPDPSRGGPDIDAAVQNAESEARTEGVHRPAPPAEDVGDSRLEQMREVDTSGDPGEPDPDAATTAAEGPLPDEVGAGGAQRIVGARISDRVAGGATAPDGPPFEGDGSGAGDG